MIETTTSHQSQTLPFKADAERVLRGFQSVLCEILDVLPGLTVKPQQIAKELSIDKKLAWSVLKIVQSTDPYAIAQYIPGNVAIGKFTASVSKIAELKPLVAGIDRAYADFEELIRVHAGDRTSLEMMLTACAKKDRGTADLSHRRMAFRGNSYIWGAQSKTQLTMVLAQPADDPSRIHLAAVNGFFRLRQLRGNAPLPIARIRHADSDGVIRQPVALSPIDPTSSQSNGMSFLKDFCSNPLPKSRVVNAEDGFTNCELIGNDIGDTAAITCVEGNVAYNAASRYRDEANPYADNRAAVCIPCEVLILDLVVREDTFGPITPRSMVRADLFHGLSGPLGLSSNILETDNEVNYLGKGPAVLHSQDVPQYPKMGRYIFDKLGWDGQRFDVYRLRIEYPVIPSAVSILFDMPDAPPKGNNYPSKDD